MEIPSRASVQNVMLMRSMLLHILIALKILTSEKTFEQEKLRNERGKRRNGHTGTSLRRTSLYRIGLVGLPLFKCDEIRLRWGFTVKTTVILLKNVCEIIGLDQL